MQGRLIKKKDLDHYVYVVEEKAGGRVVRHTGPRMKEAEAREHLRAQGLDESQIEAELRAARRGD